MGSAPAIRANSRLDSGLGIGVRRRFPLGKRQKLPSAFPSCKDPGWRAMTVLGRRYSGRWAATSVACLSLGWTAQPRKTMTGIDCKEVRSNQRKGWRSVEWSCPVSPSFGVPQEVGGRVQIGDSGHTCVDTKSHQRSTEHRERCLAARERGWVPGAQGQTDIVWGSSHHAGPERRRAERAGARSHFAIELFFFIPANTAGSSHSTSRAVTTTAGECPPHALAGAEREQTSKKI